MLKFLKKILPHKKTKREISMAELLNTDKDYDERYILKRNNLHQKINKVSNEETKYNKPSIKANHKTSIDGELKKYSKERIERMKFLLEEYNKGNILTINKR